MPRRRSETTSTESQAALSRDGACQSCTSTHAPSSPRPSPLPQPEAELERAPVGARLIDDESLKAWDELMDPTDDEWMEMIYKWRRGIDDTWDKEREEELRAEKQARAATLQATRANRMMSLAYLYTQPATSASAPVFLPRLVPHLFPRKKRLLSPHTSLIARDAVRQERDRTRDELAQQNKAMNAIIMASTERTTKLREILAAFEQARKAQKREARLLSAKEKVRGWMLQMEVRAGERALDWMLWTEGKTQECMLRTEERVREWILRAEAAGREERARGGKLRSRDEAWAESIRITERLGEILTTFEQARRARERGDYLLLAEERLREGALRAEERAREEKLRRAQIEMLDALWRAREEIRRVEEALGEKLRAARDKMLRETPEEAQAQADPTVASNPETIRLERMLADWNGSWETTLLAERATC
ncbi:hypothetical protein BD779DRAFT_1677199 [Infundibulicybe gibba]|nr:hypothetical protein BD779DRAFT_1677199 [Infundibulicybe gibba]